MPQFKIKEKRRIIAEAHAHGASKKAVARRYNISPNQIRRWTTNFNDCPLEMLEKRANKITLHLGKGRIHGEIYDEVHNWFVELRQLGLAVKLRMLTDKYRALVVEVLPEGTEVDSHIIMTHRVWRYLQSEHLVVRRGTHISQNVVYCEVVIADYRTCINTTIRLYGYLYIFTIFI